MLPQDVKWLQVENTTRCSAWCPACGRNQGGYGLVPDLVVQDLDLQRFQQVLEQFPNLETIQFCGTYGDTMAAQNVLEHVSLAKNHCKKIQIHTHGGIRNEHWWSEFAVLLKDIDHDVWFALDGLKGVHEIYRQGTDFDKTIGGKYSDCHSLKYSKLVFDAYLRRYGQGKSPEERARIWNGGPKGNQKALTLAYWKKVKANL